MTPNDDTASFVVDEDAASAAENSSIVTRSSSAREVVSLADITFSGNTNIPSKKLRKQFEETKRKKQIFSTSKFDEDLYLEDQKFLINYYNTLGFRDARIISDSM